MTTRSGDGGRARPGLALLLALALLAATAVVAQRADFARPVLTGSDQSMFQYDSFRLHVARDGPHDLLIFGNSVARQGVAVPRLMAGLEAELGRPVLGYNFGAGGTPAVALPTVIRLAYRVDRAPAALVVVTVGLVSEGRQAPQRGTLLRASPYGRALADPVAWRGRLAAWLLDHVALVGLRHRVAAALLGERVLLGPPGRYHPQRGYRGRRPDAEPPPGEEARVRVDLGRESGREHLVRAIETLQGHGAAVALAEGPLHPDEAPLRPGLRAVVSETSAATGAVALRLPESFRWQREEFADARHTNAAGAARYTDWLVRALPPLLERADAARQKRK